MLGQKFNKKINTLGMKLTSKNNTLGVKMQPNKLKSSLFSYQNEPRKSYLEK